MTSPASESLPTVEVVSHFEDALRQPLTPFLLAVLVLTATLVLILACSNVASVLLARGLNREHELALRCALGASRSRVICELLLENALLALGGLAIGLPVGRLCLHLLALVSPEGAQRLFELTSLDTKVLLLAAAVTLLTPLLSGLAPALHALRLDLQQALRREPSAGSRRARRSNRILVGLEIGFAIVLTVEAVFLLHSAAASLRTDPGADLAPVSGVSFHLAESAYPDTESRRRFLAALASDVGSPNGATSLAMTSHPPTEGMPPRSAFRTQDGERRGAELELQRSAVGPGYFELLEIPLLRGRTIEADDTAVAPRVAVVSRSAAELLWPGLNPLGRRLRVVPAAGEAADRAAGPESDVSTHSELLVVGEVGDVRHPGAPGGTAQIYLALLQSPPASAALLARSTVVGAEELAAGLRRRVWSLDGGVPVEPVKSLLQLELERRRGLATLAIPFGSFALFALLLAATGVYAVAAYSVGRRRHELTVRAVLGARPGQIARLVLGEGGSVVLVGGSLGVLAAFALSRALTAQIPGLTAVTPSLVAGSLVIAVVALAASWLPARRAARLDPAVVLRAE